MTKRTAPNIRRSFRFLFQFGEWDHGRSFGRAATYKAKGQKGIPIVNARTLRWSALEVNQRQRAMLKTKFTITPEMIQACMVTSSHPLMSPLLFEALLSNVDTNA